MRRLPLLLSMGALVVFTAADAWFLAGEHHDEFWWTRFHGFYSLFAFAACLAIVLFAKSVLSPWLQRKEDYYKGKT